MTRDEAIDTYCNKMYGKNHDTACRINAAIEIDMFVALGLLKLDEPKTAEQKLSNFMADRGYTDAIIRELIQDVERAGLKLVEKDK